jgi:hypothetical protein
LIFVNLFQDYAPLLIKNINSLKDLKEEKKTLILDKIDWSFISRERLCFECFYCFSILSLQIRDILGELSI